MNARQTKSGTWTITGIPTDVYDALQDIAADLGSQNARLLYDPRTYGDLPMRPVKKVRDGLIQFARLGNLLDRMSGGRDFHDLFEDHKFYKPRKG